MIKILAAIAILLAGTIGSLASGTPKPGQKPNRLLKEASPYLRQHAYNPVNWYPWGKEAFDKAAKEDKPILLSVGYSTCHWCHVMERESYSDKAIAKFLNDNFVAIKVDRERRPAVDETYMLATQITTGRGGWPNNVFLTPDLKPFVGGTYFPPEQFQSLLSQIALRWTTDRKLLQGEGERIATLINRVMTHRVAANEVTPEALRKVAAESLANFDTQYGGLGTEQKFPRENLLLFLLDRAEKYDDQAALTAATGTLDGMIRGGIHDHVGGGFHRYTVDRKWITPHFEKMLYNQAQIGRALVQAYRITGERRYRDAARGLFDFVLRDMTSPTGGFYSAFDADSPTADGESEEGIFYIWNDDDFKKVLGATDAAFASRVFGLTFEGNFEGFTILHLPKTMIEVAVAEKTTVDVVVERLNSIKARLLKHRTTRKPPHRDDKQLTYWNGLMIKALAQASLGLGTNGQTDQRYKAAALKAANFFWNEMGASTDKLARYHYDGKPSLLATQSDYAMLALGLVAIYDLTRDTIWLERAAKLAKKMDALFLDKKVGDYFMTSEGSGFYRPKTSTDGDVPAGNAAALELYTKLSRRHLNPENKSRAEAILAAISGTALDQGQGHAYSLRAADELLRGETGAQKFLAKGRVRATARLSEDGSSIKVAINVAKGWHINAHKPLEEFFIATNLTANCKTGTHKIDVNYPKPLLRKLGFNDKELALYEGQIELDAKLAGSNGPPRTLTLTVQTCSDKICLEPETISLSVLR